MIVSFLGTSGAQVSKTRDNTSYLIEVGDRLIMIDCSGNPAGKTLQLNKSPSDIDIILLTHLHIDHCYGLPTVLFHMFLDKRTREIILTAPDEEFDLFESQLKAHGIFPDVRTFTTQRLAIPPVSPYTVYTSDTCRVTSAEVDHSRPCRAYRLDELTTGRSVVFSGDTRPSPNIVNLARNADVLIHEASFLERDVETADEYGHSTARQAARTARDANVGRLVLVHFDFSHADNVDEFKREAQIEFSGEVVIPDDMDSISI